MKVEDGILENVREIRGESFDPTVDRWQVEVFPSWKIGFVQRPGLWVRFWQFVFFGWVYRKNSPLGRSFGNDE